MSKKFAASLKHVLEYAEGKKTGGRVTTITPPIVDVKSIRKKLAMSQVDFAVHYGFSVSSIQNWEQGHRKPEGPARILLQVIERAPNVVEQVVRENEARLA